MDIDRELADEQWRRDWRKKNERALIPVYRRMTTNSARDHGQRLEYETLRKNIRNIFGDAFLDGIPLRGTYE